MNCNKLRVAVLLFIVFTLTCALPVYAQLRWDGGGGDGQWTNATNWTNDILPSITDDVILDNSLVAGSYMVSLPPGLQVVSVRSVSIQPSGGNTIELVLPASNMAMPGLVIAGPGYGLTIGAGATFRNASGISSGQSLQVSDSFMVSNGGRYIHQTRASHATSISQILSRAPGTETGIVEFDVPGTTGYTISASGRIYGSLVLSANAAGLARTYSSSGSSDLHVRGDLKLNNTVSYNLNLAGNIIVDGNLVHSGNTLNISSGGDNSVLLLKGNLFQTGNITETSVGLPVVELCGVSLQQVSVTGNIFNSVSLRMNNAAGAVLLSPLSLPYKLELLNGKITSTANNLLILLAGCSLLADSLSSNSFIDGPLRKEGLSSSAHFLFPVGKSIYMRWLALKNASGDFTVEYVKSDPRQLSVSYGTGIDHISKLEYWTVESNASSASAELSFTDPNSGGVTDLAALRVAQLNNNSWTNGGNIAVTGSAGANGSVTGGPATFGSGIQYFTLAGSNSLSNPLPVAFTHFSAKGNGYVNTLSWFFEGQADYFEVMYAAGNNFFTSIAKIYAVPGRRLYQFKHMKTGTSYYQVRMMRKNEKFYESPVVVVTGSKGSDWLLSVAAGEQLTLTINSSKQKTETGRIIDASGRMVKQFSLWLHAGINHVTTPIGSLRPGIYTVRLSTNSMPFVKW